VHQSIYKSPLGPLFLWFQGDKLAYATFHEDSGKNWLTQRFSVSTWEQKTLPTSYQADLDTYFRGRRINFDWPLLLLGTEFQKRVWSEILAVPHGQVTTYKKIGEALGTKAYRAIGQAVGANPVSVIVPCHRVLGTNSFGGYTGGLNLKRLLLELENVTLATNFMA
jgi:O-6-methylguanine DNA methyltransferase